MENKCEMPGTLVLINHPPLPYIVFVDNKENCDKEKETISTINNIEKWCCKFHYYCDLGTKMPEDMMVQTLAVIIKDEKDLPKLIKKNKG